MIGVLIGVPAKLKKLLDIITPGRMGNLDNLDVAVSTRAPAATALSTNVWTQAHANAIMVGGGNSKSAEFATPGDTAWQAPQNVTLVWVTVQAPGGAGGFNQQGGGGGGAGELIRRMPFPVTPTGTYGIHVGAGSTSNVTDNSHFYATIIAEGGKAGGGTTGGKGGGPLGALGGAPQTSGTTGKAQAEVLGGSSGAGSRGIGGPCGRFVGGPNQGAASGGGAASYFAEGGPANDGAAPNVPGIGAGGGGAQFQPTYGGDGYVLVEWVG
jgi:MSHA biogenesis protein MshQ